MKKLRLKVNEQNICLVVIDVEIPQYYILKFCKYQANIRNLSCFCVINLFL